MNKTPLMIDAVNTAKASARCLAVFVVALLAVFLLSIPSGAFADEVDSQDASGIAAQAMTTAGSEITVPARVTSYQPTTLSASVTYDPSFVKGQKTRFTFNVSGNVDPMKFKLNAFDIQTSTGWSPVLDATRGEAQGFSTKNYFEEDICTPGNYRLSFLVYEYTVKENGFDNPGPSVRFQIDFTVAENGDFKSIETIVSEVVAQCESACTAAGDTSDYAKALWLNDWIIDHTEYDSSLTYMSAEGVFNRGKGTCEGYHEAYTMLLNKAGIETRRVESKGDAHVWTGVKLDGNWYNVDTTWNDGAALSSYFPDVRHLYFALPTDIMQAAHKKWGGDYYISLGESAPFDAASCADNYFVRSGKLSEYIQPYLETSGAYSVSAHLAAREGEFFIDAERSWPDNYKEVIYRLVAHELAERDWGNNIKVSVGYSAGKLHFYATYNGSEPLKSIANAVVMGMADKGYSGEAIHQTPQIFLEGVQLSEGTDFQLTYTNNVDATSYPNQAVMTITGMGSYGGTLNKVFDITRASLKQASIDPVPNQPYDGTARTPALTVKVSSRQLVEGQDYTVEYTNNIEPGTARAVVSGKGNYAETATVEFTIEASSSGSTGEVNPDPTDPSPGETPNPGGEVVDPAPGDTGGSNGDAVDNATQAPAVTGGWKKTAGKWWFAYDAGTQAVQNKPWPADEWVTIKGQRYHFDGHGYMSTKWFRSGDLWYWLGSDGAMKTGWKKVSGKWYFMDGEGIMQTGKRDIDGQTYFLTGSGAMQTGWNSEPDGWYHYKSSGVMSKGWQKVKGKWYYLDPSSGVMKTGFYDVAGKRYYSNGSGAMQTGWKQIDGKWYNFDRSGAMRTNAWIGGKYWVDANGIMATNAWVGIDQDHLYYVDGEGRWVRNAQR